MAKTDKLNGLILEELAQAVNREVGLPDALITISFVDCSPDLKTARVAFSVLPDHLAGTALRKLSASSGQLANLIKRRVKLRKFPHLIWEFDATEREAERLEKLIAGIEE
jgi:ribosome-binding factor A